MEKHFFIHLAARQKGVIQCDSSQDGFRFIIRNSRGDKIEK